MENQALQALLEKLYGAQTLTATESETLFNAIMLGELSNEQIAAMLVALKVRGETIDEVNGAVLAAIKCQTVSNTRLPFRRYRRHRR